MVQQCTAWLPNDSGILNLSHTSVGTFDPCHHLASDDTSTSAAASECGRPPSQFGSLRGPQASPERCQRCQSRHRLGNDFGDTKREVSMVSTSAKHDLAELSTGFWLPQLLAMILAHGVAMRIVADRPMICKAIVRWADHPCSQAVLGPMWSK